MYCIH
jgi:hypothetical protein